MRLSALVGLALFRLVTLAAPAAAQYRETEHRPRQVETFAHEGGAFDVVAIGRIVFVYRRSSLPAENDTVQDKTRMIPRERAKIHGTPPPEVDRLIDVDLQADYGPVFERAETVSMGKAGLLWKVTWRVSLEQGGGSGIPWQYRSYVKPDGSRIEPERALCDVHYVADRDRWILSRMAFRDFATQPVPKTVVHGDQAQAAARDKLAAFLKGAFPEKPLAYRFRDQRLVEIPIAVRNSGELERRAVWEVRFVDASLEGPAILKGWPLVVWVTTDGRPSELTLDRWTLPAAEAQP